MSRLSYPRALAIVALSLSLSACSSKNPTQPSTQVRNLIVNGSFETGPRGPLTGTASIITYAGSTSIVGWTVTETNVDYYVGEAAASDSLCCVDLNGYFAAGGIAQSIPTVSGMRYTVTFSMAGNPGGSPSVKQMRVLAAGQSADFSFDATGRSAGNMGWTRYAWEFVANASVTTVEFKTLVSASSAYGPMLDAVDVRVKSS
jgi:choice-of-anchor C domain-containing protein